MDDQVNQLERDRVRRNERESQAQRRSGVVVADRIIEDHARTPDARQKPQAVGRDRVCNTVAIIALSAAMRSMPWPFSMA